MLRVVLRILLKALVIKYLFSFLPGIEFHSNFYAACALATFFSILLSFLEVLSSLFAGALKISTLGVAILIILPVRILFFWVLPTISLLLVAHCFPNYITIKNPVDAAIAALMLLAVSLLTHDKKH